MFLPSQREVKEFSFFSLTYSYVKFYMLVVFSRLLWEISGSKAFSVSRDFSSSVVFLLRIGSGLFLKDSVLLIRICVVIPLFSNLLIRS